MTPSLRPLSPSPLRGLVRCQLCGLVLTLLALSAPLALRGETGSSSGKFVPEPVVAADFDDLRGNSPFTRSLNLSDSIILTGVARIGGKPIATLRDRDSKESYVISEEPNSQGWKLMEISHGADLETVAATISVTGGESVTVRYGEKQLKPEETVAAKSVRTPNGTDSRPRPTDEERRRFGEAMRRKWGALSESQRDRVKQIMKSKMEANPKMSDRQRGELTMRVLDYVASGEGKR